MERGLCLYDVIAVNGSIHQSPLYPHNVVPAFDFPLLNQLQKPHGFTVDRRIDVLIPANVVAAVNGEGSFDVILVYGEHISDKKNSVN